MKNINTEDIKPIEFSSGIRGKHAKSYRQGHTVKITREDGSLSVQKFIPDKAAVLLDRDVREYCPDTEAVNNALRALIGILPHHRRRRSTGA